jgi:aminoglycoside phosphotransferase (APT) family kinase protein
MRAAPARSGRSLAVASHPAALAWRRCTGGRSPERVENLEEKKKTAVYRLGGVLPGGRAVIAKRCPRDTMAVERLVREEVLLDLGLPVVRSYGFIDDGPNGGWVFLEEVEGEPYSSGERGHRILAGRWLAALHAAASKRELGARLPDRGCEHFLSRLRSIRELLRERADGSRLSSVERAILARIDVRLSSLEERWSEVRALCRRLPETLSHNDFAAKNLRVRHSEGRAALLVFDWDSAGWSVPAADLAQDVVRSATPALAAYDRAIRNVWPAWGGDDLALAVQLGALFRSLSALRWRATRLPFRGANQSVPVLAAYNRELARPLAALELGT